MFLLLVYLDMWSHLIHLLQEKLWKMLKDAVQSKANIDVVKLHKSEGVVLRNSKYRQKTRSFRIKVNCFSENRMWGSGCSWFWDSKVALLLKVNCNSSMVNLQGFVWCIMCNLLMAWIYVHCCTMSLSFLPNFLMLFLQS